MADMVNKKKKLVEAGSFVDTVSDTIHQGQFSLDYIPKQIQVIIKKEFWKERYVECIDQVVKFKTFEEFLKSDVPMGMGTSMKTINKLCSDDMETLSMIDDVVKRKTGGNNNPKGVNKPLVNRNNVTIDQRDYKEENKKRSGAGNTKQAGLRKLRKDRPDLHKKVIKDELSVNAAMVQAGFRKKKIQILPTTEKIIEFINKTFTEEEKQFISDNII